MHRINHHHLFIFYTFAKRGSFTGAAAALSIAQSAVTAQIKQLENHLGLILVDRTNRRRPVLTPEGNRVLAYADAIFEASQELMNWATKGELPEAQVIRVGALSGLSRNLQFEFLRPVLSMPSVKVELITGDQENLIRHLKEHSLDLILSSHNVKPEGKVAFHSHVLTASPLVLVARPRAGRRKGRKAGPMDSGQALYLPGKGFEVRPELEAYLERQGHPWRIAGEIDDIALLRIFALRSGSVVAIPLMGVKGDVEAGDLVVLHELKGIEQRFYAITRQKRVPNRTIEQLIAAMKRR